MRTIMTSAAVVALAGACSTTYDPVQIGKDTYTSAASWGWTSSSGLRSDLYREAAAFCARQGKSVDVVQATGHDADWGGKYANAEIIFTCLDRNDPEYARKQMQLQPNVRVQVID